MVNSVAAIVERLRLFFKRHNRMAVIGVAVLIGLLVGMGITDSWFLLGFVLGAIVG